MIIELAMMIFFLGMLIGVLEEWNKKVMFFVWLIALIYSIWSIAATSYTPNLQTKYAISNWWWLLFIALLFFGEEIGRVMYRKTFGEKK